MGTGANGTAPHADSRNMIFDPDGNLLQTDDGGVYRLVNPNDSTRVWESAGGRHAGERDQIRRLRSGEQRDRGRQLRTPASREQNPGFGPAQDVDGDGVPDDAATRFVWHRSARAMEIPSGPSWTTPTATARPTRWCASAWATISGRSGCAPSTPPARRWEIPSGSECGAVPARISQRPGACGCRAFDGYYDHPLCGQCRQQPRRCSWGFSASMRATTGSMSSTPSLPAPRAQARISSSAISSRPWPTAALTAPHPMRSVIYAAMGNNILVREAGAANHQDLRFGRSTAPA